MSIFNAKAKAMAGVLKARQTDRALTLVKGPGATFQTGSPSIVDGAIPASLISSISETSLKAVDPATMKLADTTQPPDPSKALAPAPSGGTNWLIIVAAVAAAYFIFKKN